MRVLIIKPSPLAAVIHALPVLDFLHKISPGIEVDWVVEEELRDLLAGNPLISKLHLLRTGTWRNYPFSVTTWKEIFSIRASLRGTSYKFVFDLQGDLQSGLVSWLSGASDRLGFAEEALMDRKNLRFSTRQVPIRPQDKHLSDKCLRLVSVPFGKEYSGMKLQRFIATAAEDDAEAEALISTLGEGLVFLFSCGAPFQTRLWNNEGWIALGKGLISKYADSTVLLSCDDERERQKIIEIARAIGSGVRVIDNCPLNKLAAILKKVDLVVGGDNDLIQLSSAVSTPTVSFYRSTVGSKSGPRGENHGIIQSPLSCAGCFLKKCKRDLECRESISVELIMRSIDKILGIPS